MIGGDLVIFSVYVDELFWTCTNEKLINGDLL